MLRTATAGLIAAGVLGAGLAPPAGVDIAPAGEPGERMIVSGTVHASDGKTPLAGVILRVYQADASGRYNHDGSRLPDGRPRARIAGRLDTDAQGRYEIGTIKPGSYPDSRVPAHIHVSVTVPGGAETWIADYRFAGDPFLDASVVESSAREGRFSPVLRLTRGEDGILRGVRDIRMPEGAGG